MGAIKSSLEIALEKTEDIKEDREGIAKKELKEQGMKVASLVLSGEKKIKDLSSLVQKTDKKNIDIIKQGILKVALMNISLPENDIDEERIKKTGLIFEQLGKKDANEIISQMLQFFEQYHQNKKQLRDNLASRYQDVLKAKEAEIAKKSGTNIKLQPEQDPEFMKILHENYKQLKAKYEDALVQVKKELENF